MKYNFSSDLLDGTKESRQYKNCVLSLYY